MIWTCAAPHPATIMRDYDRIRWERAGGVPALLHACRESRYEYLDTSFEDNTSTNANENRENAAREKRHALYRLCMIEFHSTIGGKIFICFEIDTIFLAYLNFDPLHGNFMRKRFKKTLSLLSISKHIKNLAIASTSNHASHRYAEVKYGSFRSMCPSLEALKVVRVDGLDGSWLPGKEDLQVDKDGIVVKWVAEKTFREDEGLTPLVGERVYPQQDPYPPWGIW